MFSTIKSNPTINKIRLRHIALLLCICFVAFSLLAQIYIIIQANHDCIGADCPICQQIHNMKVLMKQIGTAVIAVFAVFMAMSLTLPPMSNIFFDIFSVNPIVLKVKMNK